MGNCVGRSAIDFPTSCDVAITIFAWATFFRCFSLWSFDMRYQSPSVTSGEWNSFLNLYFPLRITALSTSLSCSSIISFWWVTQVGNYFFVKFTFLLIIAFMDSLALVVNLTGGNPRPASSLTDLSMPDSIPSTLCKQNKSWNPGKHPKVSSSFSFHLASNSSNIW